MKRIVTFMLLLLLGSLQITELYAQPSSEGFAALNKLLKRAEGEVTSEAILGSYSGELKIKSQEVSANKIRLYRKTNYGRDDADRDKLITDLNWKGVKWELYYVSVGSNKPQSDKENYKHLRFLRFTFRNEFTAVPYEGYPLPPEHDTELDLYFLAKDQAEVEAVLKRYF